MNEGITVGARSRDWAALGVLALPTLLLSLDMSVLYLALPQLSSDLGADATQQLWITDIYGFMVSGFLITMGRLGDRVGRRRLLLVGAAAFGLASVAAAYSRSPEMLVVTRAVLGVAGATLMPSTLALISSVFQDPQARRIAIAVWMSCFMGGTALGPVVGGAMLEHFWWGSVFLLGVPVMALLLVAGPLLLPEYRVRGAGRLDPMSVVQSLVSILAVVYSLKDLAKHGWRPEAGVGMVAGIVVGAFFLRRQRRLAAPLLDLSLFVDRTFGWALGVWLAFGLVQGGSYLFYAVYVQTVAGLSPLDTGLFLMPSAVAMVAGSLAAPLLARRVRAGTGMAVGLGLAAVGNAVVMVLGSGGGLPHLMAGLVLSLFGVGVAAALGTDLIVGSAPPDRAGSASAVSESCGDLGVALGVAGFGSLVTSVYRAEMADFAPAGLPSAAAAAAREDVVGAAGVADELPGSSGGLLMSAAADAYTTALQALACVATGVFATLAVISFCALRGRGRQDEGVRQDEPRYAAGYM